MVKYIETDDRLIKQETDSKKPLTEKKTLLSNSQDNKTLIESYGLSKNARILTE